MTMENSLSTPFISISTLRVKEGKLETYKRYMRELLKTFETKEPQLIAFHVFLNEDGTEMTSIQIHPDAASMDFHLHVLGQVLPRLKEQFGDVFEFIELKRIEYYGTPSASALESVRRFMESGVALSFKPLHVGGFTRSTAG